jgi:hypothetical protein
MSLYNNAIFVSTRNKFPEGKHYVILEFSSIWIPGDERSRTNPGHGYPERSEDVVRYIAFLDEADWKREIARRTEHERSISFVAFVVEKKAEITTVVQVSA